MTPADRKPAERTLKAMLRAAEVVDDSPFVLPFKARQAIEIAVRRAAKVADESSCWEGADHAKNAILRDAGLEER